MDYFRTIFTYKLAWHGKARHELGCMQGERKHGQDKDIHGKKFYVYVDSKGEKEGKEK